MAINPIDVLCDKTAILSHSSLLNHYKHGNPLADRLVKPNFAPEGTMTSLSTKPGKFKNNSESKSPYLKNVNHPVLGDSVQFLSRVTEKRFVHKNGGNVLMSFPLGGNIYKTNSDDFKGRQKNKVLKSVLTLPNNSEPITQLCTVSDMNDSEYVSAKDELRKINKHRKSHTMRKSRPNFKDYKLETQYCSEIDFNMDSSSTDTIKKCGDGKRIHKSTVVSKGKDAKENIKPHNVWALLRNMNRFQFQTSPPLSENEFVISKQKISPKRRNNRKDLRVFETRRTEEFAYISRYDVDKSPTLSLCSSFGKITVIDKKQDSKLFKEIEVKPKKKKAAKLLGPKAIKNSTKTKTPSAKQNDLKAITYTNQKKNWNTDSTGKWQVSSFSPNNGDPKAVLNKNASVDLGYESKTTENDEDFLSFDKNIGTQAGQSSESKLSDNSGSSKAAIFPNPVVHKRAKFKPKVEPCKQINGITKVILCRGQNMEQAQQDKNEPLKTRIHHGANKSCSPGGLPRLTKTEINRQLHKYRFPVVILGKDQLRSSIHVVNSENPQFDGLEQHIWPFMKNWYGIEKPVKVVKRVNNNIHTKKAKLEDIEKKAPLKNNVPKPGKLAEKIPKIEPKRAPLPLSEIIKQTTQNQRKLKPITQLKDRVLKLLYRNSIAGMIDGPPESDTGKSNNASVNVCTDAQNRCDASNSTSTAKMNKCMIIPTEKRPWSKAKWASDFIENVIRKVKSGAYYNQNIIDKVYNESFVIEKNEEDDQTDCATEEVTFCSNCSPQTFNANDDEPKQQIAIPGFDSVLPALEIKTMSITEVAVKHCGTNIMVHFDVTIPTSSIVAVENESFLIPLNITKSLTKVFKCKTSILNAMLPAELCSVLPKMVRDIVESGHSLAHYATPTDMTCLTTISELPIRSESLANIPTPTLSMPAMLTVNPLPLTLQQVVNKGFFKKDVSKIFKPNVLGQIPSLVNNEMRLAEELRHKIKRTHLFDIEYQLMMPITNPEEPKVLPVAIIKPIEQLNTITALQPYSVTNNRSISMSRSFKLMNLIESMATDINNLGLSCFRINAEKTDNIISINMNMRKFLCVPNVVTLRIVNCKIDPIDDCSKCLTSSKISVKPDTDKALVASPRSIEDVKLTAPKENTPNSSTHSLNYNKVRRKRYVKLYRKCKSSCNVSGEKVTPLDKITNLEDFFQALGSAKVLSGVCDGQCGKKIMSSIKELKNWTTEINPEQALLVILLANKKEFANLLRYRPMLLQGIAFKRITKAIELDMEIEVIEVENLNGVSRCEGISYLPASIENQGSLYEELCWIAKNTASDFQRPFDHNSEKLLKCLLGKRKQLNPSYLRVMARYVGLGLLKSPGKRQ